VFCKYCGGAVAEGAYFCPLCGKDISGTTGSAPVTSSQVLPPGQPATSGKAVASLICGLFVFFFPLSAVAVILGHLSLSEIRKSAGRLTGRGLAITALVLGYAGLAFVPLLIIAAIAIPNLLRARIAANESSALSVLRTLNVAEVSYAQAHRGAGFTCSLGDLHGAELIDDSLAGGHKYGYTFQIQGCAPDAGGGANTKYQIFAVPDKYNQSGVRVFCSDESAVIRSGRGSAQNCFKFGSPLT
jgi:type IV pilus assembly protein PilA